MGSHTRIEVSKIIFSESAKKGKKYIVRAKNEASKLKVTFDEKFKFLKKKEISDEEGDS